MSEREVGRESLIERLSHRERKVKRDSTGAPESERKIDRDRSEIYDIMKGKRVKKTNLEIMSNFLTCMQTGKISHALEEHTL